MGVSRAVGGGFGRLARFQPVRGAAALDLRSLPALNLVLVLLVAVVTTCTLMAQNRQMAKDRLKADLDYEFNLKSEMEIGQMIQNLSRISEQLQTVDRECVRRIRHSSRRSGRHRR